MKCLKLLFIMCLLPLVVYGGVRTTTIVSPTGTVDFDDDNITTTGTLTSGELLVDDPTFFVDGANNYIGIGTTATNTVNQLHFLMTATKDILIDGSTNPREIDTGVMRFEHKPNIDDTRCITFNVDNNSRANTHIEVINFLATGFDSVSTLYDANIDTTGSTAGVIRGYEVSQTGTGSAVIHGFHVDPGVIAMYQQSGTVTDAEKVWDYDNSETTWADVTAAFNSTGTDVEMFDGEDDVIYVGMAATFDVLQVILATDASGAGIKATFGFSNGAGGFTTFAPDDNTRSFRDSGTITWITANLAGWATDTVNGTANKYWIKITRNAVALTTPPTEDTIKPIAASIYSWDENGNLIINNISGVDATLTGAITGAGSGHDQFSDFVTGEHTDHALNLDANLVVWLRMDDINGSGVPQDLGSEGMTWVVVNHSVQVDNGVIGKAFTFDGIDDHINVASPSGLPTGTEARTIAMWVRGTEIGASTFFFSYGDTSSVGKEMVFHSRAGGEFFVSVNGGNLQGASTVLNNGSWHHVALTYNPANGNNIQDAKMYIDGVEETIALSVSQVLLTTQVNLFVGAYHSGGGQGWFEGQVDDVRIYGRELSADEIKELYQLGTLDAMTSFTKAYFTEYIASRSGFFNRLNVAKSLDVVVDLKVGGDSKVAGDYYNSGARGATGSFEDNFGNEIEVTGGIITDLGI